MLKLILKIAYFAFAVVLAIIVYMLAYQTSAYDHVVGKLSSYASEKDYDSVCRMFGGGLLDGNEIVKIENEKFDLVIYEGVAENNISYTVVEDEKEVTKSHHTFNKIYHMFILNSDINTQNVTTQDSVTNSTAIRFYSADGYYDYKFDISSEVNKDLYIEKPSNVKETLLNAERVASNYYDNWGIYYFNFNEETVGFIEEELASDIIGFNLVDGASKTLLDDNEQCKLSFNFESTFFTDVKVLYDAYQKFIPIYDAYHADDIKEDEYNAAYDVFIDETEEFEADLDSGKYPNYLESFTQKELMPSIIIWKSIGIVALFVVCVAILYILIFKFAWIKSIVTRTPRSNVRYTPNKITPKKEVIDAQVKEEKDEKNN